MPTDYKAFGKGWGTLNPGWEVIDWSWHNLPEDLANADVLEDMRRRCSTGTSVEMPTAMADVISYDLIHRYGGVYANADIQPIKPLSVIQGTLSRGPWASYEENGWPLVVNAFFGSPEAEDPFWDKVVSSLDPNYFSLNIEGQESVEMVFSSGPHHLTAVHSQNSGALEVLPYYTVNPILWKSIPLGGDAWSVLSKDQELPEKCVGIHHWGHKKSGRTNVVK